MEEWQRLLEQLRQEFLLREEQLLLRERELALLHQIDLRILRKLDDLPETLSFIARETKSLLGADHTHILLKRGKTLETTYSSDGLDMGQLIPIDASITGDCFTSSSPVLINDLQKSEYRSRYIPLIGYTGPVMRSLLAVPLNTFGVLNTESASPGAFDSRHIAVCEGIAAQAALALEHEQLFHAGDLFTKVDRLIFSEDPRERVLERALTEVLQALTELRDVEITAAQILFLREDDATLEVMHSTVADDIGLLLPVDDSVSGRAAKDKKIVNVPDVTNDENYKRLLGSAIKSELAVPILLGEDEIVLGVLNVESSELDAFGTLYEVMLERFARKVTMLIAFAKLRSDLEAATKIRHANEVLAAVGDRTSNWIHRLNNRVGAMRFELKEIQEHCGEQLSESDFLRRTISSLMDSADDVLEMPKTLKRALTEESAVADLNSSIARVTADLPHSSGIRIKFDLQENLPHVKCFSADLVIDNLVRNAIEALEESGGVISIKTWAPTIGGVSGGYAHFEISDTGSGLSAEARQRLFEIGATTKKQSSDGLGFGLWWVKNCVQRSDGDIELKNSPDGGTTVFIKLPIVGNENAAQAASSVTEGGPR